MTKVDPNQIKESNTPVGEIFNSVMPREFLEEIEDNNLRSACIRVHRYLTSKKNRGKRARDIPTHIKKLILDTKPVFEALNQKYNQENN